jgi:hypothetical protein
VVDVCRCLPSLDEVDGDVKTLVLALRSHPAGQFALRMFRDHRGAAVVPCLPLLQRGASGTAPHLQVTGRERLGRTRRRLFLVLLLLALCWLVSAILQHAL